VAASERLRPCTSSESLDSPVRGGCILRPTLTIGRFADATGLTENGYRYYDAAQVEDAVTIRRLRALELPLDEIGALLEADGDLLRDRLAAYGYRVAEEVRDKHSLLIELSALVEGGGAQVVVEVRDVPERSSPQ
jgi:hypothetical protein